MAYLGQRVTIPLGQFGVLSDVAQPDLPPNALIYANNISLFNGGIEKAPGTFTYNTAALDAGIVALRDWWPDTVTQRMIAATSSGNVYRDIGSRDFSGGVAISSGLGNLTPNCQFVDGGI